MKKEDIAQLKKNILKSIDAALEDKGVIEKIAKILEDNLKENSLDDDGNQQTQLIVQPKVKITYALPCDFNIKVDIPAKKVETITGESECSFSCDQDELPGMNGENAGQEESED